MIQGRRKPADNGKPQTQSGSRTFSLFQAMKLLKNGFPVGWIDAHAGVAAGEIDEGFIRVIGKGNKERLVPVGDVALSFLNHYIKRDRVHLNIQPGHEDYVFLNLRGKRLTRMTVFNVIREHVVKCGIQKSISSVT